MEMTPIIQKLRTKTSSWSRQIIIKFKATILIFSLMTGSLIAQVTNDPFSDPIEINKDVITIGLKEFAMLPDIEEEAALAMDLELEPGGDRYFVNDLEKLLNVLKKS
jgi:hypothetical protein